MNSSNNMAQQNISGNPYVVDNEGYLIPLQAANPEAPVYPEPIDWEGSFENRPIYYLLPPEPPVIEPIDWEGLFENQPIDYQQQPESPLIEPRLLGAPQTPNAGYSEPIGRVDPSLGGTPIQPVKRSPQKPQSPQNIDKTPKRKGRDPTKKYPCNFCDANLADETNRRRHEQDKHPSLLTVPCPYCPRRVATQEDLSAHTRYKHSKQLKEDACQRNRLRRG